MSDGDIRVVGVGASAGGLDAFRSFFEAMPADSGMAFVVILHLPIDRKSMLAEILGRWTGMRVMEGRDGTPVEPNCVYVPQPHAVTMLKEGRLSIRMPEPDAPRDFRPIDRFFDSLAAALREDAVGIVLSGTGTDGALGLKAIKQNGGLTIAQGSDGTRPQYDGMPAGAIATGAVDLVLPAQNIPACLMRLKRAETAEAEAEQESPAHLQAARLAICTVLRVSLGHDFSGYREKTFIRRVRRRMQVLNISDIDNYVGRLQADHDEVVLLFRDLLIRVTSFFRDTETFAALEQLVVPRLFANKHADGAVRLWIPGCATGEEAYSLAILMREHMDRLRAVPKVQIFGTDIDEPAIVTARQGRYPSTLLEGLSDQRRNRFFTPTSTGYVVTKEIRDLCTFSPHSIVRDPPFSRMDLISCRNLLIYMHSDLQDQILPAFHYALSPGGILLLGSSESASRHEELFELISKPLRIFLKRSVKGRVPTLREGPKGPLLDRPAVPPLPARDVLAEAPGTQRRAAGEIRPGGELAHMGATSRETALIDKARGAVRAALGRLAPQNVSSSELKTELLRTRDQLQLVTEEHETALEELRSANEELHSVNEELQSTNEELETSKEELQSVNEELHTVNAQLVEKVDELDRANSDLKNLFDSTQIATIFLDRHLIVRSFTPAVAGIFNLIPSDHGRPLSDIASQLRYNAIREDTLGVLESLQPREQRVTRLDACAHYLMRILPYRAPDSTIDGALITFLDVTTIVEAEQHHRLLVDELNHRVKNMLTVVISLASQTMRRSASMEAFSQAFMGRVQALTASYTLLSGQSWTDVPMRDVLVEETKPFVSHERNNIMMDGPEVRLTPAGALALGMAVHEMATNAVKYGALSVPEGVVRISWTVEHRLDTEELSLTWTESGGPAVSPPTRRGFGMTLIERGFAHELSGKALVEFAPGGVVATLRAPAQAIMSKPAASA